MKMMRKLLAFLLLLFLGGAHAQQPPYQQCSELWVVGKHPAGGGNIIGFNTYAQWGPWNQPDTWLTADLAVNPNLANVTGIKAVKLLLMGIISNPVTNATSNVTAAFVAPGQELLGFSCQDYSLQAVDVGPDGTRSPVSLWVPVINNQFKWCWSSYAVPGISYGMVGAVNAYCK